MAYRVGLSLDGSAARTLTVGRDEEPAARFVVGAAHLAAIQAIEEIGRGKSIVTHREDDGNAATLERAVEVLALDAGPSC